MLGVIQFLLQFLNLQAISRLFFGILSRYPQIATTQATAGDYVDRIDKMLPLISAMLPVAGISGETVDDTLDMVKAAARITGVASEINTPEEWDKAVALVAARYNPFAGAQEMNTPAAEENRSMMQEALKIVKAERGVKMEDLALSYIKVGDQGE